MPPAILYNTPGSSPRPSFLRQRAGDEPATLITTRRMAYIRTTMALYRTYRPRRFADVVGQEAIVRLLQGALAEDALGHALLLSGARGCGKTTLARLIAKGLNCQARDRPTAEPCGDCDACRDIDADRFADVWELDAASNRGVDDMRALRDRLATAPVARAKVFILDEAHMLTREAQNALLKSLEEPPPRTYFVLCTTAPEKLLGTILSRCHRYPVRSATSAQLLEALQRVAAAEARDLDQTAFGLVAEAAAGSFRDGLSILDQLLSGTRGPIDGALAAHLLGRPGLNAWVDVIAIAADGDQRRLLEQLADIWEGTSQPDAQLDSLTRVTRAILYLQATERLPVSVAMAPALEESARRCGSKLSTHALLDLMSAVERALGAAAAGQEWRLPIERALATVAEPAALEQVSREPSSADETSSPAAQRSSGGATSLPASGPRAAAPPTASQMSDETPSQGTPAVEREMSQHTRDDARSADARAVAEATSPPPARASMTAAETASALAGVLPALVLSLRSGDSDAYLALRLCGAIAEDDTLVIHTPAPVHEDARTALARRLIELGEQAMPGVRWVSSPPLTDTSAVQQRHEGTPAVAPDMPQLDRIMIGFGFVPLNSDAEQPRPLIT